MRPGCPPFREGYRATTHETAGARWVSPMERSNCTKPWGPGGCPGARGPRETPPGLARRGGKAGERTTLPSGYRLELCQELIDEAMKCLGNSDKERTMKLSAIFTRPPRAAPREFRRA